MVLVQPLSWDPKGPEQRVGRGLLGSGGQAMRRCRPTSYVHTEHGGLHHPYGAVLAPARPGGQHGNPIEGHGPGLV